MDFDGIFFTKLFFVESQITVLERGVAQSKSKGKQRLPVQVYIIIRSAGWFVIVYQGQLSFKNREGNWQSSCRIIISKQNIGHCITTFFTGIPGIENGGYIADPFTHGDSTTTY